MNAEIDATIGPILQSLRRQARRHPVGLRRRRAGRPDQSVPLGQGPRADPARDRQRQGPAGPLSQPDHAEGFAEKWGQNPAMVTSFADGSKISFEQAIVANATGFVVQQRGMSRGLEYRGDVMNDRRALRHRRAAPARRHRRLRRRHAADEGLRAGRARRPQAAALPESLQDGRGPALLVLHPLSPRALRGAERHRAGRALPRLGRQAARAARSSRSARSRSAISRPARRWTTTAMYMTYGEAVNADEMRGGRYLPEGSSRAACSCATSRRTRAHLRRRRAPAGRLADRLRAEQYERFRGETWLADIVAREKTSV